MDLKDTDERQSEVSKHRKEVTENDVIASSLKKHENEIIRSTMTPRGVTPEMSCLYINSDTSSSNSDRTKLDRSDIKPNNKPGTENGHYIVIKSSLTDTDACGTTEISNDNPMYMTLEHAAFCNEDNCQKENCQTLKQFFIHYNSCNKNSSSGCTICFALDAIVCQHAKVCKARLDASCNVPNCDKVKSKIVEEWVELKTKHANLMQIAFVILSHARLCELELCQMGKSCTKMKRILQHASKCPRKVQCTTKKFLFSLCLSHKEICYDPECPVDFCREKWNRCNDTLGTIKRKSNGYNDIMPTSEICSRDGQERKRTLFEVKRTQENGVGCNKNLNENKDRAEQVNNNQDKIRTNLLTHDSNPYTYKHKNSKMISSQKSSRKPYSFGDPRQLPLINNRAQEGKSCIAKQSPNSYKQHNINLDHEFDPLLFESQFQRTQCPIYSNAWSHEEIDNFCGGMRCLKSIETEFQKIQPPTDYASLFAKEPKHSYEELKFCDSLKNDYVLWPVNTSKESIRFSPTQLQQILLGRDVAKTTQNKGINCESCSKTRGKKESFNEEMKPAKRKLMDQVDKASTPEVNIKKTNSKAMHCVRRLFPTTVEPNCSPKDSESDSEFCKNLSQDSSSQSESSDWTIKI